MIRSMLILALFCLFSLSTSYVVASSSKLPEVMVGSTRVDYDGATYYAGFNSNEVVMNYFNDDTGVATPPTVTLGFAESSLKSCNLRTSSACFILQTLPNIQNGIKIMRARTRLTYSGQDDPVVETAATLYPSNLALGDVYSRDGFADNFKYWGRNLAQSQSDLPNADAIWQIGNYTLNPQAQSTWLKSDGVTETETYRLYKEKVDDLGNEAVLIDSAVYGSANMNAINVNDWYLQNSGVPSGGDTNYGAGIYTSTTASEVGAYPEGKTWLINSDTTITRKSPTDPLHNYYGKGTIIVRGDLIINEGVIIEPGDNSSRLGIIVLGDITFRGNNRIKAAIFSSGNFKVESKNASFYGAFVAKSFDVGSASNIAFYYDNKLGRDWPPGFRYLNMPQTEE